VSVAAPQGRCTIERLTGVVAVCCSHILHLGMNKVQCSWPEPNRRLLSRRPLPASAVQPLLATLRALAAHLQVLCSPAQTQTADAPSRAPENVRAWAEAISNINKVQRASCCLMPVPHQKFFTVPTLLCDLECAEHYSCCSTADIRTDSIAASKLCRIIVLMHAPFRDPPYC
jgi:hypothetical protein